MISGILFSQVCMIIDTEEVRFLVYAWDNVIFYILKRYLISYILSSHEFDHKS